MTEIINYIQNQEDFKNLESNRLIGTPPVMMSSCITFKGKNNLLVCQDGVELEYTSLYFGGDNSIIYLNKSHKPYQLSVFVYNDSNVYFGEKNFFASQLKIICSETKNIFIGDSNLFSHNVTLRNADAHLIYDIKSKKRINLSKSVFIGDHVWLGQSAFCLKNTKIHSGSIVGANSVVSKELMSNSTYVGAPIKKIKSDTFWNWECVHEWTMEDTNNNLICDNDDNIYNFSQDEYIDFDEIDFNLTSKSLDDRYDYLRKITLNKSKNRFAKF